MFGSHVLETAIGLSLLFLGISLVVTAIQEFAASALSLRANTLLDGLKSMMVDGEKGLAFYNSVIAHPVVKTGTAKPSYISSEQFSTAALHLMNLTAQLPADSAAVQAAGASLQNAVQALAPSPFKQVATSLLREGGDDLKDFETRLQHWFDQSMDRISGIYKRQAQWISVYIGGALAFLFQVDAIHIAKGIWGGCCSTLGTAASTAVGNENSAMHALAQFDLTPIWEGWGYYQWTPISGVVSFLLGCCITTAAVSLGAPFWFDTLQSFVSLRGTGPQPASTTATDGGSSNSSPVKA
jgi:hypothetical protein